LAWGQYFSGWRDVYVRGYRNSTPGDDLSVSGVAFSPACTNGLALSPNTVSPGRKAVLMITGGFPKGVTPTVSLSPSNGNPCTAGITVEPGAAVVERLPNANRMRSIVFVADIPQNALGLYDVTVTCKGSAWEGVDGYVMDHTLLVSDVGIHVDMDHDGEITDEENRGDNRRALELAGFGLANHLAAGERLPIKIVARSYEGPLTISVDNPHAKFFGSPDDMDELGNTLWLGIPHDPPLDMIYLELPRDVVVNITLSRSSGAGLVIDDSLQVTLLSNGLGAPDGTAAHREVVPGLASVGLMRGNLYVGGAYKLYRTPALGPDVTVSYNHFDGIAAEPGPGWRTNYDMRVIEDEAVELESRRRLALIDETGRRHVFTYSVEEGCFMSEGVTGLVDARVYRGLSDPEGGYRLVRHDNRRHFFDKDGFLVRIEDIRGQKLKVVTDGERAVKVYDDYGRMETLPAGGVPLSGGLLPAFFLRDATHVHHSNKKWLTVSGDFSHGAGDVTYELVCDGDDWDDYSRLKVVRLPGVPDPEDSEETVVHEIGFEYNPDGRAAATTATVTEPFGGTTVYEIKPEIDMWTKITGPEGVVTERTDIDEANRRVEKWNTGSKMVATVTYDPIAMAPATVTAGGAVRGTIYTELEDVEGSMFVERTTLGGVEQASFTYYDSEAQTGLVHTVTRPVDGKSATTIYEYDTRGYIAAIISAAGSALETRWTADEVDRYGQPRKLTCEATSRFTGSMRFPTGLALTSRDISGFGTSFAYDSRERLRRARLPGGAFVETDYDPFGRVTRTRDASGKEIHREYDALGRLVKVRQAGIGDLRMDYIVDSDNPSGVIVEKWRVGAGPDDGDRLLSSERYDLAGRLAESTVLRVLTQGGDPTGCTSNYGYYPDTGLLHTVKTPRGEASTWTHEPDAHGRPYMRTPAEK